MEKYSSISDLITCPEDYRVCIENFLELHDYYVFDKVNRMMQ